MPDTRKPIVEPAEDAALRIMRNLRDRKGVIPDDVDEDTAEEMRDEIQREIATAITRATNLFDSGWHWSNRLAELLDRARHALASEANGGYGELHRAIDRALRDWSTQKP